MLDISFADTFQATTRDYSRPNAYWLGTAARLCYHDQPPSRPPSRRGASTSSSRSTSWRPRRTSPETRRC